MIPVGKGPILVRAETKADAISVMIFNFVNGLVYILLAAFLLGGSVMGLLGEQFEMWAGVVALLFFAFAAFYWGRFVFRGGLTVQGKFEDLD